MTNWQSGDVETNGIHLHYTRTGGTKPPLVLVHGVTDNGLCWTPVAEALEADYDVIMVDARGHGESDAPETGYDSATQAADLAGVITGLELHKPMVLGHSMGAATVFALAGLYPDLPGAILLEDPPGWCAPPPESVTEESEEEPHTGAAIYGQQTEEVVRGMKAWLADFKSKTYDELITERRAASPDWSEAELEPWARSKLQFSLNLLSLFDDDILGAVDWRAIVPRITCPVLLITADPERGAIFRPENVTTLEGVLPQLEVVHIPGAGHNVRREQFTRYLEVVRDFLTAQA
jgi:N-formylmaleamate deformylase